MPAQAIRVASQLLRPLLGCAGFGALALQAEAAPRAAPASPIAKVSKEASIPFLYEDARLYVPVRIRRGPPRWFILDTGATGTIVDSAAAAAEHLPISSGQTVHGAGGGSSRQERTEALKLHVGSIPLDVAQPGVMDLAHLLGPTSGRAPAGIIGSQFFREHFVAIDFVVRRLTVLPRESESRSSYEASIPLTFADWTPLANVLLTLPDGRVVHARTLVDLGAKSTLLEPEPFIAREKLRDAFPKALVTGFGAGVGGDTFYAFARARRLSFADAQDLGLDRPVVGLSVGGTLRSTWNEGLLGAEFLEHFRVGFDYYRHRLLLSRADASPQQFDRSGAFLIADGAQLRGVTVRSVVRNGPAETAGLEAGDRIVALDAQPVSSIGLSGVRERLKRPGAGIVSITYRRGADQRTVRVKLRDLV